jgi:hypothetical protein
LLFLEFFLVLWPKLSQLALPEYGAAGALECLTWFNNEDHRVRIQKLFDVPVRKRLHLWQ